MTDRISLSPLLVPLALLVAGPVGCNGTQDAGASGGEQAEPPEEQVFDLSEVGFDQGPAEATVRVIEFSDFGCVHCQRFHAETYPAIHEEFVETGKIAWKYIPISLAGFPNADEAQHAAECAGAQGRFFELKPLIYEHAREWTEADDPDPVFHRLADEAGLDGEAFEACVEEGALMDRVESNRRLAAQIGIRGTPTFVVNGMPVQGAPPLDAFREALNEMVEAGSPAGS